MAIEQLCVLVDGVTFRFGYSQNPLPTLSLCRSNIFDRGLAANTNHHPTLSLCQPNVLIVAMNPFTASPTTAPPHH
jgi:hypothetical protein